MPYRIFSYISPRALGDVVLLSLFASSVAELFDDSELVIYYRDDRPYKAGIVSCIRNAKRVLKPASAGGTLPIELFDMAGWRPSVADELNAPEIRGPNLILSQTVFQEGMLNSIPLATLAPPPEKIDPSDSALMELGLDPERWVATIYWEEPGYGFRPLEPWREIADPEPYIAVIRHIIENLGGQVVRLGHPSPTALPKMKGLIDLAHVPDSEWLQLYAVWISRFLCSSLSGPLSYGPAFNVPTVVTDQRSCLGVYRAHDYIVTQGRRFGGKILRGQEAFAAGLLYDWGKDPAKYVANTAQELIAAADEMYGITGNCVGWRAHQDPPIPTTRPNKLCMPLPVVARPELFIPPSQRLRA